MTVAYLNLGILHHLAHQAGHVLIPGLNIARNMQVPDLGTVSYLAERSRIRHPVSHELGDNHRNGVAVPVKDALERVADSYQLDVSHAKVLHQFDVFSFQRMVLIVPAVNIRTANQAVPVILRVNLIRVFQGSFPLATVVFKIIAALGIGTLRTQQQEKRCKYELFLFHRWFLFRLTCHAGGGSAIEIVQAGVSQAADGNAAYHLLFKAGRDAVEQAAVKGDA